MTSYLYHGVFFVLLSTVISIEMYTTLIQTVVVEKVVQPTHYRVGTFASHYTFINLIVHLINKV